VTAAPPSPAVRDVSWGRVDVDGFGRFKDVKLFPGGAREWDWRETGTSHSPGIQTADVEELVEHGAETVVLSTGMLRRLKVRPETLEYLDAAGVSAEVLPTKAAVERYGALRSSVPVGALIHSTC
jgi:hypothetical protein